MVHLFIRWNVDPVLAEVGNFGLRYYSLLFVGGLILGYFVVQHFFKKEGISQELLDKLTLYAFIGILLGARLGHCLFYEPGYYLRNPLEIILPIRGSFETGFEFIGYQGLASHGAGIGILIAIYLYSRKYNIRFFKLMDIIAVATPLTGIFLRLGNLMNSEIIGKPTDVAWAFQFVRVDPLPRHPAQLYEAFAYLLIFLILYAVYNKKRNDWQPGIMFGLFLILLFSARFIIEFAKEIQVGFENSMALNMGQLLSIPYIIAGAGLIIAKVARRNT